MIENRRGISNPLKRPWVHMAFYAIGFLTLIISHEIAPTNLAGLGLDALVLLVLVALILYLFIEGLLQSRISIFTRVLILLVHLTGMYLLFWLLNESL